MSRNTRARDRRKLNIYWKRRLGWEYPNFPSSFRSFLLAIKKFQETTGLVADGILGPKTFGKMQEWKAEFGQKAVGDVILPEIEKPKYGGKLIIDDREHEVDFNLVNFLEPAGFSFLERGGWRLRKEDPRLIILHWTVTATAHQAFETLGRRSLSTHFIIENDGTVYQCLDPMNHIGYHAREVNKFSIGVYLVNPVLKKHNRKRIWKSRLMRTKKANRGTEIEIYDYTDEQKQSLKKLLEALCQYCNIRYGFQRSDGVINKEIWKRFNGILGHYHIRGTKWDPGIDIWDEI